MNLLQITQPVKQVIKLIDTSSRQLTKQLPNANSNTINAIPHNLNSWDILKFLISLLIFMLIALACYYFINKKNYRLYQKEKQKYWELPPYDALTHEIVDLLFVYSRMAVMLHSIYIILGATTILTSVFVTTFINSNTKLDGVLLNNYLPLISFISTSSMSLITAFSLGTKANNCRRAWRLLVTALDNFRVGVIKIDELVKKRDEAEAIVGGVDFQYK